MLYPADEFIESLLRHRLSLFDCEGGNVATQVVAIVTRFVWNSTRADFTSSSPLRFQQLDDRSLQILHNLKAGLAYGCVTGRV